MSYDNISTPTTKAFIKARPVVSNDTADVSPFARGLWVGVGGDVAVLMGANDDVSLVTFKNVASGTLLPIVVRRVLAAGTTASSILALH